MLSDRPYMRGAAPSGGRTSVLAWILSATAAMFILQSVAYRLLGKPMLLESLLGLTLGGIRAGHVWTLVTYGLVHDQQNLLQIIFNGLMIYFLGRDLLPVTGPRRFVGLYAGALALGGVFWLGVNWHNGGAVTGGLLLGAVPAVTALLALYALLFPDREITLLLLFIPVTVKPKYVALAVLGLDLFCCVFYEVFGAVSPFAFAPSAHLGGMAAGWLYYRLAHDRSWSFRSRPAVELPAWMKRKPAADAAAAPAYHVNLGTREHLRAEVDRILDKINSQGFGALTPEEKRLLDEARDLLSRR
jgi:membrane associated rhomboid family serine protease